MAGLTEFVVLYKNEYSLPIEYPLGFHCYAEDSDHAEEQFYNYDPNGDIIWVVETTSYADALQDYWDSKELNND